MILIERLSRKSRIFRYVVIGICAVPLIGSWLGTKGYHLSLIVCPVRHWTGVICPSCGMTRSFIAIARGDWRSAIDYHLFGPLLLLGFGLALAHVTWELSSGRSLQVFYLKWLKRRDLKLLIVTSFFAYYLLRLHHIIPAHQL